MYVSVLSDLYEWKSDIEEKIIYKDSKVTKDKNFEVEHSFIDFQKLIIC